MDADRLATRLNPAVRWILGSRLHPLLSAGLMLVTVTGRRSGRRTTLPVGYQRHGDTLTVLVSKAPRKRWWRNYRAPGPVEVRLRGRMLRGEARVVPGDSAEFREAIEATLRRLPWLRRQLGFPRRGADGPSEADWHAVARDTVVVRIALALLLAWIAFPGDARSADARPPLTRVARIALPDVAGRIDHLAVDPSRRRLVVAELGENAVDVVDLESRSVLHRIAPLDEPQGIAFSADGGVLVVAGGGDGSVRLFDAKSYAPIAAIPLGSDADNVHIDPRNGHAVVGYGDGGLAVIDLASHGVLSRIGLGGHPEGFQIESGSGRAFANVPGRREIAVLDLDRGAVDATWPLADLRRNYPLALGPGPGSLLVAFRSPARLVELDRAAGTQVAWASTCGDADDVFVDAPRRRVYVACGAGFVDVFESAPGALHSVGRVATSPGARTALFVPDLDLLFVAAPARGGREAEILVLRPMLRAPG